MGAREGPVLILGDGGWGTALAIVLADLGRPVRLWSHDPDYAAVLASTRRNPKFLPNVVIPSEVEISSDAGALSRDVTTVFAVVPTQFLRSALERVAPDLPGDADLVSCSKGLERETLRRPSEILAERFAESPIVVLSGPSHAEEVARRLPAAVVAASSLSDAAKRVQRTLSGPRFRVYTGSDPIGVEVSGAAKNVIAIAAGICDGLGFGDNARAGLITRGLREVARLGVAMGAERATFSGLSGAGDLIVTCTSTHSRNHTVGFRIGRGESLADILRSTETIAEGVETARSLLEMAERLGVDVPISREVHAVLFEGKPAREAVEDLMAREARDESG